MRKKMVIVILSFIFGFIIMSGGYGLWQKKLIIEGVITVQPGETLQVTTAQAMQVEAWQAMQVTTGQAIELTVTENQESDLDVHESKENNEKNINDNDD